MKEYGIESNGVEKSLIIKTNTMQLYTMNREGYFFPVRHTSNQCRQEGTNIYLYKCRIVFDQKQRLDKNQFLIDHIDVNEIIIGVKLSGSCETMAKEIMEELKFKLTSRNISYVAIKISIFPYPIGQADLSYTYIKEKSYLSLLN